MEQFIDGVMAGQRESHHIVGAVVVVVMDGDLFFAKGYGPANLERNLPVDPSTTLFRIGSVTKLLTASAVMRLWEQDKLRLDENVNHYLRGLQVPATFPEPITLSHLLAHTAGFEDRSIGLFSHQSSAVKPLVITLANELPARVRPPGTLCDFPTTERLSPACWCRKSPGCSGKNTWKRTSWILSAWTIPPSGNPSAPNWNLTWPWVITTGTASSRPPISNSSPSLPPVAPAPPVPTWRAS